MKTVFSWIKWIFIFINITLLPIAVSKTLDEPTFNHWLTTYMQQQHIPGVSIAIIKDYEVTETKGFGVVKSGEKTPITPTTQFQAGELTQAISATLALDTHMNHKMALHVPVNRLLKSWRLDDTPFSQRRALTVDRILSATSGVNVTSIQPLQTKQTVPSLLQLLQGQQPATNPKVAVVAVPGQQYQPSVGGFMVLQQILEDIYQQPFATLAAEKVFEPLKMTNSTFTLNANATPLQHIAYPHNAQGFSTSTGLSIQPAAAANGLWTTPNDLAKWLVAGLRAYSGNPDQAIHPKVAKKLFNTHFKSRDEKTPDTSLGLITNVNRHAEKAPKGIYFTQKGHTEGYQAIFIGNKTNGDGAVIMLNVDSPNGGASYEDILVQIAEHEGWQDQPSTKV